MSNTKQISLRTAVLLPFVLILMVTLGVAVALQKNSYEKVVFDISGKQLTSLANNTTLKLDEFLFQPFQASIVTSHSIESNHLYQAHDMRKIEALLYAGMSDLYQTIPHIDGMGFGGKDGDYVGFRREADKTFSLLLQEQRTNQNLVVFRGHEVSDDIRSVINQYDPRTRPWYTPIAKDLRPVWSPIYTNSDERQEVTLTALAPVISQKQFQGVLGTDIKINTFNNFLRHQKKTNNADVYVFDSHYRLVAHSDFGSVLSVGSDFSQSGERQLITESHNPIIKASAQHFTQQAFTSSTTAQRFSFRADNERYFNLITPYQDEFGLKWFVGVVISETELLGNLYENQRNSWGIALFIGLIGIIIGFISFSRVITPITATANAAKTLATGNWQHTLPKPGHIYETTLLVSAFSEMASSLKSSFKTLKEQLLYDSLTKLYSREGLVDTCDKLTELNGCLFIIGINKFRDINDSLGHQKGDQLLIVIAERLKHLFPEQAYLSRIGGDEFAVYLKRPQSEHDVTLTIRRIQQMFTSPFVMEQDSVVIQPSIGIVQSHQIATNNMTLWLRNGSIALSNAKDDLTNRSYYTPEMADISRKRTTMQTKIKNAIESHEFVPYYQPIVDLKSGKIIGAEALARWHSPTEGIVSPLDFIPIAEESGLIGAIGAHILSRACQDMVNGVKDGKWNEDFHIHVNLSVRQLSQPDFIDALQQIMHQSQIQADRLTLEITESCLVDNDPRTIQNMQSIRDLGVQIAIDDFGTGYSSLAYLYKLPFDCLKIDRTFVEKMQQDQLENSIVAAIINMTKGMNVDIVAEGIETQNQADLLNILNCPHGQGYLFSRPIPYEQWPTNLVNMK